MWQQRPTALDISLPECGPMSRPHHLEKHSGRLFPREHGAEAVVEILRLQPVGVEF
jgi:hypothetical protein